MCVFIIVYQISALVCSAVLKLFNYLALYKSQSMHVTVPAIPYSDF